MTKTRSKNLKGLFNSASEAYFLYYTSAISQIVNAPNVQNHDSPQYVNLDPTPTSRETNSPETSGPRAHCSGPAPVITGNALSGTEMFRQKM